MKIEDVIAIAKKYKSNTASRYLPVAADEILTKVLESELYAVSTKYDGHMYVLHYNGGKAFLVNHGGNVVDDLLVLKEATKQLKGKCKSITLAGELYLYSDKKRTRSFDLSAALDDKSLEIRFAAFDILMLDEQEQLLDAKAVSGKLSGLLAAEGSLHPVTSQMAESRKDIAAIYKDTVEDNAHEGIVIRSQNGPTYKVKPLVTLEAIVLGFSEGEGIRKGMLRDILVGLKTDDDKYLSLAKIGNGYTDAERKKLLSKLDKLKVASNYIEVSGSNVAFTMIKPELVVEFNCLDVFNENSKGPIRKMALSYHEDIYNPEGKAASASVMAPVFMGFRDDKKPNAADAGISQITKILGDSEDALSVKQLKESSIIKREVYVKESKGKKMVRKFLLWQTHKEQSGDFPAFVFHYTDYSPSRGDMLKNEIKVSNSQKQIEQIFAAEVIDNVKKGWVKE